MGLEQLARRLSDRGRIGLTEELVERLKIRDETATRGRLLSQQEDVHGHLGVYLMGAYVVEDTDFWTDGQIYWWSMGVLVGKDGRASWDPLMGLPTGAPPHKVGSLEWMTNLSLGDPPLLAVIPPDEEVSACVLHLGILDDDGEKADVSKALTAGLEALAEIAREPAAAPEALITPVRQAIGKSLKVEEDDILLDQALTLRRGEVTRFNAGFLGSEINALVRVYYLVRDEERTQQVGPFTLHKGQIETIRFPGPIEAGGRISLFARGADVTSSAFGTLTTDMPFLNRVLDVRTVPSVAQHGFTVNGSGPAKFVAFYTPP